MVCIPTFRRPEILARLLDDLARQEKTLDFFILVIDGDSRGLSARDVVRQKASSEDLTIGYVWSIRANLPFQRLVGWMVAEDIRAKYLVYLDDDLRTLDSTAVAKLINDGLKATEGVNGATARIDFGADDPTRQRGLRVDPRKGSKLIGRFSQVFRKAGPGSGSISPVGTRRRPDCRGNGRPVPVDWLQGGVMAFKVNALRRSSFPDTLLALYERRFGKGEDTIISRSVLSRGGLVYCCDVKFQHPNTDTPQAYDSNAWKLGFVVASSRRYLCDMYRGGDGPKFRDRVSLIKHYIGGTLVALARAVRSPSSASIRYACGFIAGAGVGLVRSPAAERLTPGIDFDNEAQLSVENLEWFVGRAAE